MDHDSSWSFHCLSIHSLTPAECAPLPKDMSGSHVNSEFSYASVIGMLLYFQVTVAPILHLQYTKVLHKPSNQSSNPKLHLCRSVVLIVLVFLGINSDPLAQIHCQVYPDADFVGLFDYENFLESHCACSSTGSTFLIASCPILSKSMLQAKISMSTMESMLSSVNLEKTSFLSLT